MIESSYHGANGEAVGTRYRVRVCQANVRVLQERMQAIRRSLDEVGVKGLDTSTLAEYAMLQTFFEDMQLYSAQALSKGQ